MKIRPELLKKYATGDCTEPERLQVEKWLAENEDLSTSLPKQKIDKEKNLVWQNISNKIRPNTNVFPLHRKVMQYAAAIIIFLTVATSAYFYVNQQNIGKDQQVSIEQEFRIIETQRGQKKTIKLPDGSTERLNYESQLKIPLRFTDSFRVVYLQGHAHFEVFRDTNRPFIIYTGKSKTQVLGTSFDIKTNEETDETEIIVTSGKVAFSENSKENNKVIHNENNKALLRPENTIKVSKVNAQQLTAWKDNYLEFNKVSLAEIIKILEPWYDVEITVKDPKLLTDIYKFSYENPPLKTLFERMSFMGKFNYSIKNKQVTIY